MNQPHANLASAINHRSRGAFTLIELLVVISIISMLMSILLPSLSRAREQAKRVHCQARLKEFGNAIATYENDFREALPPALWLNSPPTSPDKVFHYGWAEILFAYVYREPVQLEDNFPVQRNIDGRKWQEYMLCQSVGERGISSGHYRVYLPSWAHGSYTIKADGTYGLDTKAIPTYTTPRDNLRPRMPLIGDANEFSERGDGLGSDDCSYIDAGEANIAGSDGRNGNRFSDRHSGGSNYLFQDLHAEWSTSLRQSLAEDWDLNGIPDITILP